MLPLSVQLFAINYQSPLKRLILVGLAFQVNYFPGGKTEPVNPGQTIENARGSQQ
jgi:hypothetical protein